MRGTELLALSLKDSPISVCDLVNWSVTLDASGPLIPPTGRRCFDGFDEIQYQRCADPNGGDVTGVNVSRAA